MKSIICKAYNKKEKKWYWFDVMWGDEHGNFWMLPDGEVKKCGRLDNRIRVDPLGWEVSVGLSPYNPSHLDLGNEECCGIFNSINDEGIIECNECGMNINDVIKLLTIKEGDTVKVSAGLKGAPDEIYKIIRGKGGNLILDDVMGTALSELNPEAIKLNWKNKHKIAGG